MNISGDFLRLIFIAPFFVAGVLLFTFPALQLGIHVVRLATGNPPSTAPRRKWWEGNTVVPLMGIIYPLTDLPLKDQTLAQPIFGNPFAVVTSIGIVTGIALALAGVRRTNWAMTAATSVLAGGSWLLFNKAQFQWANVIIILTYAVSASAFLYLLVKNAQLASGTKDEFITDFADPVLTDRIRNGIRILACDGETLSMHPKVKFTSLVSGFLHKHLDFTARAQPDGLYLRIPLGSELPDADPFFLLKRRAVWFLVPWNNLDVIKFDRIIGHTEIRLRLCNSGHELVLVHPPKNIEKYLPELRSPDGHLESAAAV